MTGSTDAVHLKGDRFPPQGVPEPGMACVSDSARTRAAALVRTAAFRRLRDVSFLGGIDYLSPLPGKSYSPRKASCSRHEHSLGVGRLFSLYAGISGTSEYLTKLGLAAALLHDIGHPPLSHSLEPLLVEAFGLDHHKTSENIITGRHPLGEEVREILKENSGIR